MVELLSKEWCSNTIPDRSTWIYWGRLIVLAYTGIRVQRLRAFLSASGITVGIAAVITILAIGEGAREEALEQIQQLGTNTIFIKRTAGATQLPHSPPADSLGLSVGDALRLERVASHITTVAPTAERWVNISVHDRDIKGRLVGTTPEARDANKLQLETGRFLVPADGAQRRYVCVLGDHVSRELFHFANPLGQKVRIGEDWFQVIGVLKSRVLVENKQAPIRPNDINRNIYVPLEVVASGLDIREAWPVNELTITVAQEANILETAQLVRTVLARTHRGVRDYEIIVPLELLKQRHHTQTIFNAVLAGIAALSLLVGGIGIMNIMLATVTERTPEIGVRRAVGATAQDITLQFLTETATLTFLGGLAGVLLGVLSSWGVSVVWGWPIGLSSFTIGCVLGIAIICGVVFGLYPALKAAAADPIEALRYE
jgi:putative ABC transport system permease protein